MSRRWEKILPQPIQPHQIRLSPTLDLVAVVIHENQLEVFRFDGNRAFGWNSPTASAKVVSLCWRPDGTEIALARSDNSIDVIKCSDGRLVRVFDDSKRASSNDSTESDESAGTFTCLGWSHFIIEPQTLHQISHNDLEKLREPISAVPKHSLFKDWIGEGGGSVAPREDITAYVPHDKAVDIAVDLPRQLALLDVLEESHKLSALPRVDEKESLGLHTDEFVSQCCCDSTFRPLTERDVSQNSVDGIFAFHLDGETTVILDKTFFKTREGRVARRRINCTSHPLSQSIVCLWKSTRECGDRSVVGNSQSSLHLSLQFTSLDAIGQSGRYFVLASKKTEELKNLSNYICHSVAAIRQSWASGQDLPSRYITNVRKALCEDDGVDLDAALYHQAVIGHAMESVREWLAEDIQDRGHKRWDEAVTTTYQKVVEIAHLHLLPAIDRASVVATRLRSLSRTPGIPIFNVEERYLTRVLNDLEVLRVISYTILTYASDERRQFGVFSTWLQFSIQMLRAEPGSTTAREAAEKAAGVEIVQVLRYIQGPLLKSHLNFFLERKPEEVVEQQRRPQQQLRRQLLLQILDRHKRLALQPQGEIVEPVNLLLQALFLRDSVAEVAAVPARGFERSVKRSEEIALENERVTDVHDLRMVVEEAWTQQLYVAAVPERTPEAVRIHSLRCEDFLAAPREFRPAVDAITRSFPAASPERSPVQILSLRFLNDTTLVSLARTSATSTSLFFLKRVRPERRLSDNQWSQWVETGRFDDREGFEPVSMEVKETGQYPTGRICLLGRSGERLVILEVDRDGKAG